MGKWKLPEFTWWFTAETYIDYYTAKAHRGWRPAGFQIHQTSDEVVLPINPMKVRRQVFSSSVINAGGALWPRSEAVTGLSDGIGIWRRDLDSLRSHRDGEAATSPLSYPSRSLIGGDHSGLLRRFLTKVAAFTKKPTGERAGISAIKTPSTLPRPIADIRDWASSNPSATMCTTHFLPL